MKKIYKTITIPLKCSKSDREYLNNCNKLSAEVWNKTLEIAEQYREQNDGKWIQRNELQKLTKNIVPLHAKGIHHIAHKYLFARDSALKAKQGNGINNKFPHRNKRFMTTGWDIQSIKIDYKKGIIKLSKPNIKINDKNKTQKPVICYAKTIPNNIVQIELIYRKGYRLSVKYIENVEYLQVKSNNKSSIDLGEIHSITSIDNNGNAIIITGRKMRSVKQFRNKEQGKIYRRLSKCKKDSIQYKRYMKALSNLTLKTDKQMNDCVHKITKLYVDYCLTNNISTVLYGDLDSATRSTKENGRMNGHIRQKLGQWNYGQIVDTLKTKLNRYGIEMIKVKEYYTSQKCPSCKTLNKPNSRKYTCDCGYRQHRDIVGAINILNDNTEYEINRYQTKMYLQIS